MKNKNLFNKSMLIIMAIVFAISVLIIVGTQSVIKGYFRNDSYEILNNELEIFQTSVSGDKIIGLLRENAKVLRLSKPNKSARSTIIIETRNGVYHVPGEAGIFIELEKDHIKDNEFWPLHGSTKIQNETVFYAINPIEDALIKGAVFEKDFKNLFYLAYISEAYSADLTYEVMKVFVLGLFFLIASIDVVLLLVFRKISLRLKVLEQGTQNIGKGVFNNKISTQPYDEIGRLGEAMNTMGQQLKVSHDTQAENFQMISHELKTPIMVMQGYLDALENDLYPNGSKASTMKILSFELKRLETLTKDILFLSKTEYLSKNDVMMEPLELGLLFKDVIERLKNDSDIKFEIEGEYKLIGDLHSWVRIIENILSNQIRYAKAVIKIKFTNQITIENDGELIPEVLIKKIDKPFVKGINGKSGLGLTIVSNTLKLYDYSLNVSNLPDGVIYTIRKN